MKVECLHHKTCHFDICMPCRETVWIVLEYGALRSLASFSAIKCGTDYLMRNTDNFKINVPKLAVTVTGSLTPEDVRRPRAGKGGLKSHTSADKIWPGKFGYHCPSMPWPCMNVLQYFNSQKLIISTYFAPALLRRTVRHLCCQRVEIFLSECACLWNAILDVSVFLV